MVRRSQIWRVVDRLYVEVETALWAALAAFVIFFCALILPEVPANVAKAQAVRALEVGEENQVYCEKWGMKRGTQAHIGCTIDLQQLRNDIEQRRADATMF
jgi:hypothetical protein